MTTFKVISIIGLIILILTGSRTVYSEIIWSENFDEENSLDDWDITYGNWSIQKKTLLLDNCTFIQSRQDCISSIWHAQTRVTGTWSFDILPSIGNAFGVIIWFIGNGETSYLEGFHPHEGYAVHFFANGEIGLDFGADGSFQYSIDTHISDQPLLGWQHIDITRDTEGEIIVYLNGTEILDGKHTTITSSENINIRSEIDVQLDNFGISDLNEVQTEESPMIFSYGLMLLMISIIYSKIIKPKKSILKQA
ncbi:MAG: hypothetical protein ACXAD7_21380 [Candidatus Kariarchaeaceae archaeon]|jgi:hypothetical protein